MFELWLDAVNTVGFDFKSTTSHLYSNLVSQYVTDQTLANRSKKSLFSSFISEEHTSLVEITFSR